MTMQPGENTKDTLVEFRFNADAVIGYRKYPFVVVVLYGDVDLRRPLFSDHGG
jgi:hypothetical protein